MNQAGSGGITPQVNASEIDTTAPRGLARRAVLRGLAIFAPFAAVASAGLPAAARAAPADAQSIAALCDSWLDLQRQADELGGQMDAIEAAAEATPPPSALLRRADDGLVGGTRQAIQEHPKIGQPYRPVHVDQLRHLSGGWSDPRSAEIVGAFDAWRATVDDAKATIDDLEEEREQILDRRDAVHAEIVAAPIASWAGVAAKAALAREITMRPDYTPEDDADGVPLALQVVRDVAALATAAA